MIDYEKLKVALELADKYSKKTRVAYFVAVLQYVYDKPPCYCLNRYDGHFEEQFTDIDELIKKLQKLTESNTKFKIGQKVWRLDDEEPYELTIGEIDRDYNGVHYRDISTGEWWHEEHLYQNKELLIECRLAYWTSLKNEEISTDSGELSKTTNIFDNTTTFSNLINEPVCILKGEEGYSTTVNQDGTIIRTKLKSDFDQSGKLEVIFGLHPVFDQSENNLEKVCKHESEYDGDSGKYVSIKCKKCGEFYK